MHSSYIYKIELVGLVANWIQWVKRKEKSRMALRFLDE